MGGETLSTTQLKSSLNRLRIKRRIYSKDQGCLRETRPGNARVARCGLENSSVTQAASPWPRWGCCGLPHTWPAHALCALPTLRAQQRTLSPASSPSLSFRESQFQTPESPAGPARAGFLPNAENEAQSLARCCPVPARGRARRPALASP